MGSKAPCVASGSFDVDRCGVDIWPRCVIFAITPSDGRGNNSNTRALPLVRQRLGSSRRDETQNHVTRSHGAAQKHVFSRLNVFVDADLVNDAKRRKCTVAPMQLKLLCAWPVCHSFGSRSTHAGERTRTFTPNGHQILNLARLPIPPHPRSIATAARCFPAPCS